MPQMVLNLSEPDCGPSYFLFTAVKYGLRDYDHWIANKYCHDLTSQ